MKLYSYCLKYDDGIAPNPFWDICTLVICKPKIRKVAQVGDWVVGLGASDSPIGDISDCVVYAMKVTKKMTMQEYDEFCRDQYPNKIPQWRNLDNYRLRLGDCIYDYSQGGPPNLRWGAHEEKDRERDLSGLYALISTHFYYFGDKPQKLPPDLHPIIHRTQGHKSDANRSYVKEFIAWIEKSYDVNHLYGEPQGKSNFMREADSPSALPNCSHASNSSKC